MVRWTLCLELDAEFVRRCQGPRPVFPLDCELAAEILAAVLKMSSPLFLAGAELVVNAIYQIFPTVQSFYGIIFPPPYFKAKCGHMTSSGPGQSLWTCGMNEKAAFIVSH